MGLKKNTFFCIAAAIYTIFLLSLSFLTPPILNFLQFHGYYYPLNPLVCTAALLFIFMLLHQYKESLTLHKGVKLLLVLALYTYHALKTAFIVERVHMILYSALALLYFRIECPQTPQKQRMTKAFLGALAVGTLDEIFQLFIPGRQATLGDIYLNGISALLALLFLKILKEPRPHEK